MFSYLPVVGKSFQLTACSCFIALINYIHWELSSYCLHIKLYDTLRGIAALLGHEPLYEIVWLHHDQVMYLETYSTQ